MREILFRGKGITNGKWQYGSLLINDSVTPCESLISNVLEAKYVDPTTIGQYTGLLDKNGVKIFEGDIVRIGGERYGTFHKIVYESACFILNPSVREMRVSLPLMGGDTYNIFVVGNIYDNPELLEGAV